MNFINSSNSDRHAVESADVTNNKTNHPGFIKNLSCYFTEFCQNTSLNGLKFIGEKGRSIIERFWWVAVLTISFCLCMDLILKTYQKWERSPVIVNFATSQTPIWQIPFPAITICPETKSDGKTFNYSEIYSRKMRNVPLSENRTELYEYMALICHNFEILMESKIVDEKVLDFITKVAPTVRNSLRRCKWMSVYNNCSSSFTPVITEVGVCFSFNILDRTEMFANDVYSYKHYQSTNKTSGWSVIDGYSEHDDIDSYPQRALFSTAKTGLSLTLKSIQASIDPMCGAGIQGFKVHVHHPGDMPSIEENYFRVSLNEAVSVAIKPIMMSTNEKLYSYPPEKRHCYFRKEKSLRFFKMYSQQNCQVECLTNFTLKNCGCVAFNMPRINTTSICDPANKNCMVNAEAQFLSGQIDNQLKHLTDDVSKNSIENCDCLPACVSTTYDVEITQTPWDWKQFYDSEDFRERVKQRPAYNSKLVVYFKDRQIMTSQRNELYGYTDFIANCGGLLGLFIGFSVISLTELVYFVTLRFICNLRAYGIHFWSGDRQLLQQK